MESEMLGQFRDLSQTSNYLVFHSSTPFTNILIKDLIVKTCSWEKNELRTGLTENFDPMII